MKISETFKNKERIENLRSIVCDKLTPLINGDFVLLDVPNHRNIGDLLIWQGELEYLKTLSYRLKYSSNIFTYRESKIDEGDVILMHGGGNFGDVWRLNQNFRNQVIERFRKNRIIIFPQTIHYNDEGFVKKDAALYNNHPDLTICVRDKVSYKYASKHFNKCRIILLPDMAFFLNFESHHTTKETNRNLVLKRLDKELGRGDELKEIIEELENSNVNFDIKDWPGFVENGTFMHRLQYYSIKVETKLSKRMINTPIFRFWVDDNHGLKGKNYKAKLIAKGIEFINKYDVIYSTRLHGFILSVLLNKEVYILDNSYGKNKNYFETWLVDFENVKLIS